jgi:hypothetical protein
VRSKRQTPVAFEVQMVRYREKMKSPQTIVSVAMHQKACE